MAVPNTRQRAKELVQQIAKNHGYLGEEKLRSIEPELRREIEEAFLKKDQMIGSSVITLAKNLYTSKARFVFELLQNADDNHYTKAVAIGKTPYVSFRVFPRQIIMECNEDGFTNENLEAICSVGKSSKTGNQGYIGEKGIGFKSVFMAAWKAHIQSGAFSFSFSHRNGESGMGMISPIWEETEEDQDLLLTRLTLHLHDTGDPKALENTHQIIQEQFQQLQETILLFMKNLRMIRVAFYGIDGAEMSSMEYSIERPEANRAVLTRTVAENGVEKGHVKHVKHYHVTTHQATNVPRHENRTYGGDADHTSQVVLAFPLEESSAPIIEPQDIFVYLPVRPVGFKFIIQADFVTDASRQDIVRDSLRNNALLDGVADAFARAVLQFCEYDVLRLRWMRYLPDRNDKNWGSLWLSLVNKIADRLSKVPVLYCHKRFDRHLIGELFRLTAYDVDADGEPLFDDGDPEIIVSQHYASFDLKLLEDYGLEYAHIGHTLNWLATDLARGAQSRMRSGTTTASWHTQAAKLLHLHFAENKTSTRARLKVMALLPLKDGTWVSATSASVYFAKVDGIDIPPNIGLRIIDDTITNTHRITLFKDLGVETAPITLVPRRILELYEKPRPPDLSLQASKQQLTFLYLTQHLKSWRDDSYSHITIFDQNDCMQKPSTGHMYMATDRRPYSPWELLKRGGSLSDAGRNTPGFTEHDFVNEGYLQDPPQTPPGQEVTWTEWFHRCLGVEDYVFLGDWTLSGAGKYLQQHRPERFLGALRIHHHHNPCPLPKFIASVQEILVLCQGNRQVCLKNAYFPAKRLEILVERFVEREAFFPWLWIDPQIPHDTLWASWDTFLSDFNDGVPLDDLEFALDMLKYSAPALKSDCSPESESKLCDLYIYIHSQYLGKRDDQRRDRIRDVIAENNAIYVPLADSYTWASPKDCVWSAAQELQTKFVLEILYKSWLSKSSENRKYLKQFFCDTLGIFDCTEEIYVDELKKIRDSGLKDSDVITEVYKALHNLWKSSTVKGITQDRLKEQFENHALIYVASNDGPSWRKTSQCVWSTARLRDMVSLNKEYEELHEFFVGVLGVRPVTLKMAIDELKQAGNRRVVVVEEVKASLLTVNSLLCSEPDQKQEEGLEKGEILPVESKIFPVRYPSGEVQCASEHTHFFIADRDFLRSSFEKHVKLLDFSLEEVVRLRHFLEWAGLEDRYISLCVRPFTSVEKAGAQPIPQLDRQFRHRAHALLRISQHFESPRVTNTEDLDALYELLRNAKIFATDKIFQELSLSQDGRSHTAQVVSMNMHLHEGSNLEVYLPRRKSSQQFSLAKHLPERILEWLMTDKSSQFRHELSNEAVIAIKDVWNAPLEKLSTTLDECGIIQILTPDLDPYPEELSSDADSDDGDDSEVVNTPASAPDIMGDDFAGNHSRRTYSGSSPHEETESESNTLPVRLAAHSRPATPSGESLARDTRYVSVLGRVIASARTRTIPDRNDNQPNTAWSGSSNIHGSDQFERDCKVGAAGELFVFELLSRLDPALPDFSRANWQSNMRHYVTVHPEYASMSPWTGRETSDITYMDTQGVLTELLISTHYLDRDRWEGRTPKYFIEVKTTTSSCDAPFYMSNAQYQRMRNVTLSEGNRSEIYVIFRVYQLDQGDQGPGLRLYLDPESLRLSRALDFTATTWSVTPGENAL